ncbi:MAG: ATPase, T2SS/T4P/T4SS family [Verrucomicrobiota bacterium]
MEDPIEYIFQHKLCRVKQREIGADTKSFPEALRHILRQDPDVILISEMRDLETIAAAITAAETGHLVLATLHTIDAPKAIEPHRRRLPRRPAGADRRAAGQRAAGHRRAAPCCPRPTAPAASPAAR